MCLETKNSFNPVWDTVSRYSHFYHNPHLKTYTNSRFHLYPYTPYPLLYRGADTYIQSVAE